MIDYLSLDDALSIIDQMGVGPLRDPGLLESALQRPRTTVFGEDAYASLTAKAGALMHSLAPNHALVDGNKRLAWVLTRAFLRLNDHDIQLTVDDAEALMLDVAAGRIEAPGIAVALAAHLHARG